MSGIKPSTNSTLDWFSKTKEFYDNNNSINNENKLNLLYPKISVPNKESKIC